MPGVSFDGKPFKSVTQGAADLALIPLADAAAEKAKETPPDGAAAVANFLIFVKAALGEAVAEVEPSERLTDSAVCLVAPEIRARPRAGENSGGRRTA